MCWFVQLQFIEMQIVHFRFEYENWIQHQTAVSDIKTKLWLIRSREKIADVGADGRRLTWYTALVYTHLIKCLANRLRFDAVKQQKCEIEFGLAQRFR